MDCSNKINLFGLLQNRLQSIFLKQKDLFNNKSKNKQTFCKQNKLENYSESEIQKVDQYFIHQKFMSVGSQPLNTISYTKNSLAKNHMKQLRYIHLADKEKFNYTIDHKSNNLPLNLFLSPTEYSKMLITNGKSRKKNNSQIINGQLSSLQYHNDSIFQKLQQKRQIARQSAKPQLKTLQKHNINSNRSCFNEFCNQCVSSAIKYAKIPKSDMKKVQSTIEYDQLPTRNRRYSTISKPKKKNSKFINSSNKANSSLNKSFKKKSTVNDQSQFNHPLMKQSKRNKNPDISHLLIKSLIQFNESKKVENMIQKSKEKNQKSKEEYLKFLNQKIRAHNLTAPKISRSRGRSRSITKHDLALQYWENIKEQVLNSLKNDKYSQALKTQLKNYNLNVYDHKEIAQRQLQLSQEQINYLRVKHQQEAKMISKEKEREKRSVSERIENNLKNLQKQRRRRIEQTSKKPFQPTSQMLRSAFINIIQENQGKQKSSPKVHKVDSLFNNEGIRMGTASKKKNFKK